MRAAPWILIVFLAFGCARKPLPFPPPLVIQVEVGAEVNPDAAGRPSPLVLRLYQLKDAGALESADFFEAYDNDEAHLGDAQLWRQEVTVVPGSTTEVTAQLAPDARAIAVVAAFRDVRNSRWKASAPVAVDQEDPPRVLTYLVSLAAHTVSVELSR